MRVLRVGCGVPAQPPPSSARLLGPPPSSDVCAPRASSASRTSVVRPQPKTHSKHNETQQAYFFRKCSRISSEREPSSFTGETASARQSAGLRRRSLCARCLRGFFGSSPKKHTKLLANTRTHALTHARNTETHTQKHTDLLAHTRKHAKKIFLGPRALPLLACRWSGPVNLHAPTPN